MDGQQWSEVVIMTTKQMKNTNRMRRLLRWIKYAAQHNIRATPLDLGEEMPAHTIELIARPKGELAGDFIKALEVNSAALGLLIQADHAIVVSNNDLKTLLAICKNAGAAFFDFEEIRERGLQTLDAADAQTLATRLRAE